MDFLLYEPEDFASDESYLKYYFRLNDSDIAFWQGWISNHPEKLDCIINADQLISLLSLQLDESELLTEYQRLSAAVNSISAESELLDVSSPGDSENLSILLADSRTKNNNRPGIFKWGLAAIAIGILVISAFVYSNSRQKNILPADIAAIDRDQLLEKDNTGTAPLKFQLEDGSVITLQPGSTLNYPPHFLGDKREVFLEGDAFFEVSKNKNHPFYVYCRNMVAHVLGTSFNIKTDKVNGKVEVAVSTGKVEIYEKKPGEAREQGNKSNGLILTPNQKAIYIEENNRFESSLVEVPLPIPYASQESKADSARLEAIYLKAAPMSEIVASLEKMYGIEIEIENDNINNCHFSGDYSDMNLFGRLDVICQSLNASYEVKGTKILIRGRGCN